MERGSGGKVVVPSGGKDVALNEGTGNEERGWKMVL